MISMIFVDKFEVGSENRMKKYISNTFENFGEKIMKMNMNVMKMDNVT